MELIVVRHPAVAVEPGVCYGRSDVPLAGGSAAIVAAEFAEGLVTRIAEASPARARWLDTSPSIRCASVAAHLGARYGLAVREDADLMELDHGRWEMARWDNDRTRAARRVGGGPRQWPAAWRRKRGDARHACRSMARKRRAAADATGGRAVQRAGPSRMAA
ncbi:MAG: histidine phosphatase family protein [Pararobbsia sp.]